MRLFLTGATGYLGGDVLYELSKSFPAAHISCLVRSEDKARTVKSAFPDVRTVLGDLDDAALLQQESQAADIVLHIASTGHAASFEAIAKGLSQRSGTAKPRYWIQIGGGSVVSAKDINESRYGEPPEASYDDTADSQAIKQLIRQNKKRVAENILLSQSSDNLRYALILGPLIYGEGRGPGSRRSMQAPEMARVTLQRKKGFTLGRGLAIWSSIHVCDVSSQIAALVKAAQQDRDGLWNSNGIYAVESGSMEFKELGRLIAQSAHDQGLIDSPDSDHVISADEANTLSNHAAVLWGTNAVFKSTKSQSLLGWAPSHPSLTELVPAIVKKEAAALKSQ